MRISEKAVISRVNRKLAHCDQRLRKSRYWNTNTLAYYVVDLPTNGLVAAYNSLEQVAREVGALADHENLDE